MPLTVVKQLTMFKSHIASRFLLVFLLANMLIFLSLSGARAECADVDQENNRKFLCDVAVQAKADCDYANKIENPKALQICAKVDRAQKACDSASKCVAAIAGVGKCDGVGNNDTQSKCDAATAASADCNTAIAKNNPDFSIICDNANKARASCNMAKRCDKAKDADTKLGELKASCNLGLYKTHYGFPAQRGDVAGNWCIPCVPGPWGCLCPQYTWCGDFYRCLMTNIVNPAAACLIKNLRPSLERAGDVSIPAGGTDNYYRDLCISGADISTDQLSESTGLFKSKNKNVLYGSSAGFVSGAKPERNVCMSLLDIKKFSPPTSGNSSFAYYKNANNVDFKTNGIDAYGKDGEYKAAYGDSQNLYKSSTFPIGSELGCPADVGGNAYPKTAADWKNKMGACYDYYVLQRATHPEWTLERAGDVTDDPLTEYNPTQAIFNSCQPLRGGVNGFSSVMQYPSRPDLDEADYDPSVYLSKSWKKEFSGKNTSSPFQNLFPCVLSNKSKDPKRNWMAFNSIVAKHYAIIAFIECTILEKCEGPVIDIPIRDDATYNSPGKGRGDFCPNVERINYAEHPFAPRDDYKKVPMIAGNEIYSISQNYGTDRGYSWETSLPVLKERSLNGIAIGYTDYNDHSKMADTDFLIDRQKHPAVQCAIVPVDILEPRREQFNNCIMQRIEYNYHSWRFNNFVEYYGLQDDNWTPPCKTRFYEHDDAWACPVKYSIQQCCRIIVKDVVPINYLKMRTCEGLRQKRNVILGFDHIYDGSGNSVGGKKLVVDNQEKYDEAALINQKLSLIGCDGTEPEDYSFKKYFPSDLALDLIQTKSISDAIDSIRQANNIALIKARQAGDVAMREIIKPALPSIRQARNAAENAVKISKKQTVDKITHQLVNAQIDVSNAMAGLVAAKATIKAQGIELAKAQASGNSAAAKVAQDAIIAATKAATKAAEKLATAKATEEALRASETAAYQALATVQDTENSGVSAAQQYVNDLIQQGQDKKDELITKGQTEANKVAADAYDKLKDELGKQASEAIDKILEPLGDKATLIEGGSHMPYMRWWDTGTSAGNPNHGGSFINTLGSYDVIVGVGREERTYEDARNPAVKKHLDADAQTLTQKSQIGRIDGWEGLKGHQMWTTRKTNLTCIGRTEKLFKPYGAENFVLAKAGAQYDTKMENIASGIQPKTGDKSGQVWPWSLGWRGYVSGANQFHNSVTGGLDNADKGDIIVFSLNGMNQIAYVTEANKLAAGVNSYIRIESWDQGKFPTAAGVSIASGNVMVRAIYRDSVPPDYRKSLNMDDAAKVGDQPSCEDPNYTSCVLPAGIWDSAKVYRPRADISRICPYAPSDTTQTAKIDSNIWAKCVYDGYDPPLNLRRLDGYNGVGTGANQDATLCGAPWGTCSSTAASSKCYGSGIAEDCTKH